MMLLIRDSIEESSLPFHCLILELERGNFVLELLQILH
jgi:hypothetical protein